MLLVDVVQGNEIMHKKKRLKEEEEGKYKERICVHRRREGQRRDEDQTHHPAPILCYVYPLFPLPHSFTSRSGKTFREYLPIWTLWWDLEM